MFGLLFSVAFGVVLLKSFEFRNHFELGMLGGFWFLCLFNGLSSLVDF